MKASRIFLASAVAIAALTSCNTHDSEPESYRNVPIKHQWVPQFVTIDWETASPEVKNAVKELVDGGARVFNTREELKAFDEYGLFEDPLSSVVWDLSDCSVVVNYVLIGGIPDKTRYNMYFILIPAVHGGITGYVFNTSYIFSGGNPESSDDYDDDVIVVGRNAIIVDKLPADAKVTTTSSVASDIWFN